MSAPTNASFRRLLLTSILAPVVLMIAVAAVLLWQISTLLSGFQAVELSDQVLSRITHLQKLTVDLETGIRGYLVTGSDDFLQPFNAAKPKIDSESHELMRLIDTAVQQQYLNEINFQRTAWLVYANQQIELRKTGGDYQALAMTRIGKRRMDSIRSLFDHLEDLQGTQRADRVRLAQRQSHLTLGIVGAVALLGGGLLSILSRYQFGEIVRTYDTAIAAVYDFNQDLERRVADRTHELAEANKELEAFGYSISHDLRAPMRHITGFSDLLGRSATISMSADDRENLQTINSTARLAGRMVDDLLAFSRVGRATLRLAPVDLNVLVEQCRADLAPDVRERKIDWQVGPLPTVMGDTMLLKLVVQNLLQNAVKYTNRRPVAVIQIGTCDSPPASVPSVTRLVEEGTTICFFRDNGVGFDMAYVGKLFGVFQRLHRSEDFEGTGIGLASVKRIINRLGGVVWAEGELDRGAVFYFSLPVETARSV